MCMAPAVPAERLELAASCLFGLEGPLANELRHMGMEDVAPENGRVRFTTDKAGIARANLRSRFAERILLLLGSFKAGSFDELFEGVRALPLEDWLGRDAAFPVEGWSVDSALHSVPDCQRIIKKAAAVRLGIPKLVSVTRACTSKRMGLVPSKEQDTTAPEASSGRPSSIYSEGFSTSASPCSCISNTPISLVEPNRFFTLRRMR